MNRIKLVVFDLSGTTVEDDNAVAKSLHRAAVEYGLEVSLEEFQQTIGTNKIHLYQYMIARNQGLPVKFEDFETYDFPELEVEALTLFDRYSVIMLDYYRQHVKAMPGAEETFRWCRANGIKVATDTGFHRNISDAIIESLAWKENGLIDLAVHVELTGGVGRPAPYMIFYAMQQLGIQSVHQVVKVGDTPADLLSGKNAGCIGNIGVLSGANSVEVLGRIAHTHLLRSVGELPGLLEQQF
ncbi:MAG: HAD hydrolase-like protein [Saprospiraceae bacterium]|nr:HAD hydrolase-like protein [Lewinella sp.]